MKSFLKLRLSILISLGLILSVVTTIRAEDINDGNFIFLPFITNGLNTTIPESDMILIPAGEFQMGCDPDHNGGYSCNSI